MRKMQGRWQKVKKIIAAVLAAVLVIFTVSFLAACESGTVCDVVCTVFPQYDFCRKIAGGELSVKMLLPVGTDAHNYMLTTKDKSAIKNCKLFVYIGGESENWVKDVIKSTDLSEVSLLNLSEKTELIYPTDEHEDHEEGFDEHIWLSIKNSIILCRAICEKMAELFPDKKEIFYRNCKDYISELGELETRYAEELSEAEQKTLFFADRFPFAYLVADYGLNYRSVLHGCSTDTVISPIDKIKFSEEYKSSGASGVFVLESGDDSLAESVIRECGGKIYRLNSCQTVSEAELKSGKGYIEIMSENLEALKEGLK